MVVLFANYKEDTIPHKLKTIINTPSELFETLKSIEGKDMKLSNTNELILTLKLFSLKKEFALPLERTDLSNEDRLVHENNEMKQKITELTKILKDVTT